MTERQLHACVKRWQGRLALLGVTQWRVNFEVVDFIEDDGTHIESIARMDADKFYDTLHMQFRRDVLDKPEQEIHEIVVHEWLHVLDRDRDEAESAVLSVLGDGESEAYSGRINAAREKSIERLARLIVALHG